LAAAASDSHVYVIGGMDNNDRYVAQVEYAPIHADGSLGEWHSTTPLEEPRFYLAAAIVDNYLYAIGGANGNRGQDNIPSATVERALIRPDGSLGPWQRVSYLTTPRRGLQAAVYRNHIYAIGGYNGVFLNSVERADVNQDGTLAPWQLDPEQAVADRYIHSAASLGDKLYLLGGHEQNPQAISYGDVEMSRIIANGGLRPWEIQKTILKTPRFIAAAFAMNHFIYMLGGHDGRNRLRSVEVAPLDAEGRVGPWSFTTPLHDERSATALAVRGDKVYVFGGMGVGGALNTVEIATQNDDGQLGYREPPTKE
jgi:kelch-like protein 2/3